MELFFKEHRLLIILQIIQFSIVASVFWLAGYRDISLFFYVTLLSLFCFIVYLIYHYVTHEEYYGRLSKPIESLDESLQQLDNTDISIKLNNLLKSQYDVFEQRIMDLEIKQEEHRMFMDRWIHQMKTPLSVIELMATDLDEPISSNMREEIDRMKVGLNTVLYMARLRTIEQDFHIKQVNLLYLIQEVNQENKRFYIRNEIYPIIDEIQPVIVETDEKWIYFIVTQLVHNAVKYSQNKAGEIKIRLLREEDKNILEIIDFGVGIPKGDLNRVFDAFYTGENGRKFRESTGMGLYLVKEVATYLGHRVEIESSVGEGTTIRLIF